MVWRQLEAVRDTKFINTLENFIQENVGKKYALTPQLLLKQKSVLNPTKTTAQYESFFCSQLVAATYKALGFLPQEVSTTQYWPVTFSQKENLQLIGGAKLGIEMIINFDL